MPFQSIFLQCILGWRHAASPIIGQICRCLEIETENGRNFAQSHREDAVQRFFRRSGLRKIAP